MFIDYEILKLIWWLFIGVLLAGFAVMDGQDMGVGTLLPFIGKNDDERRVMINSVAPHWDGNQVWFITGGGAIFAAWPLIYATAFSGFYWAMLLVLFALLLVELCTHLNLCGKRQAIDVNTHLQFLRLFVAQHFGCFLLAAESNS